MVPSPLPTLFPTLQSVPTPLPTAAFVRVLTIPASVTVRGVSLANFGGPEQAVFSQAVAANIAEASPADVNVINVAQASRRRRLAIRRRLEGDGVVVDFEVVLILGTAVAAGDPDTGFAAVVAQLTDAVTGTNATLAASMEAIAVTENVPNLFSVTVPPAEYTEPTTYSDGGVQNPPSQTPTPVRVLRLAQAHLPISPVSFHPGAL